LTKLKAAVDYIESLCVPRRIQYPQYDFTKQEVDKLLAVVSAAHSAFGGGDQDTEPPDVDAPLAFKGESLLRSVEATAEMLNVSEHTETLLIRIRGLLTNTLVKSIISDTDNISLEQWLTDHIGADKAENGCLCVIDLSLVPTEVVHIITSVIARMIFEALQRYRKIHKKSHFQQCWLWKRLTLSSSATRMMSKTTMQLPFAVRFSNELREKGESSGSGLCFLLNVLLNCPQQSYPSAILSCYIELATTRIRNWSTVLYRTTSRGCSGSSLPCPRKTPSSWAGHLSCRCL